MRSSNRLVTSACAALVSLALARHAFAAAQLAAGAKTSAKPTATNPQQRQIQITFDPDISAGSNAAVASSYSLTGFQLSVQYDPTLVSVQDVNFVDPYTETPVVTVPSGVTPAAAGENYLNNPQTGIISHIAGQTGASQVPAGEDVNIFLVDFTLNEGVSFDTPLFFKIFADPNAGDFISGTDPNNPNNTITTPAADVEPTTILESFNAATNDINGAPLPRGAAAGLLTLGTLAAAYGLRRRARAAAAAAC